jgi:phage-related protein
MKMFRDEYTNFSFNEQDSSSFKVWITNKNDLKRNMSPNFSDKFNTPTYGQIRYHEGTTIDKQDFKLSCVAVNVTLTEWRAITEWLSPLVSGKLRFDWNEKYYYMVKLSKAPSGTMFMKSKIDNVVGQLYIINFDIEFTTVND